MLVTLEIADVVEVVADEITRAVAPFRGLAAEVAALRAELAAITALPPPVNGKDADPAVIKEMVAKAVAALPPAPAGKDADMSEVQQMVAAEVERAVAARPPPSDGHTPTEDDLRPIIAREVDAALAARPLPVDGKDADPAVTAALIEKAVAALPPPLPGKSVTVDELRPMVEEIVERRVAAFPPAKDGVGLTGAVIDRDGQLVLTLSDGGVRTLGAVVGRDADPAEIARTIAAEVAKIPAPKDGVDGLGFDDITVIHDGERGVVIRFIRGEVVKDFPLTIPAIIDRGVWREGHYAKGDGVTWDGSFFIAQRDTAEKPLTHPDWRQAVKAGRPGKNTETVKYLPATVKLPGPPPTDDADKKA